MGLREIADGAQASAEMTLEEAQAEIETQVVAALAEGYAVVEIQVPHSLHETLRQWVESEGMRCGCSIEADKTATLVIAMTRTPPPPKSAEEIKAEIDAAVANTARQYALEARVAELETALAVLQGGV